MSTLHIEKYGNKDWDKELTVNNCESLLVKKQALKSCCRPYTNLRPRWSAYNTCGYLDILVVEDIEMFDRLCLEIFGQVVPDVSQFDTVATWISFDAGLVNSD